MAELKKTTLDGLYRKHYHILYLNVDKGFGLITPSQVDGHSHEIQYQPSQPEQTDEQGNVISPATAGGWIISPGPDGHTHGIADYVPKQKKSSESEEDIVRDIFQLYKIANELEKDSVKAGEESEGFYFGDKQWEDEAKRRLAADDRACVTINFTARYIDELIGYQIQNRTDIRYLPKEGGDQVTADILNEVVAHISDVCNFEQEETEVFTDAAVAGRGIWHLYADKSEDPFGEPRVERFPWKDVRFGPHEKKDASDAEYFFKEKMFSMAKLKMLWPDKAEEIQKDYSFYWLKSSGPHTNYATDQYGQSDNSLPLALDDSTYVDLAKKEFKVLECWRRKYVKAPIVVNLEDEFYFNAYGWDKKDIEAVKKFFGFPVIERQVTKIRITKIAGNVVLSDEDPADLPADTFFIVPVYAKKRGHRFWGKVESLKDSQREVNKRHSQAIDIGNKMAGSWGWFFDQSTFPDSQALEQFRGNASKPGFTQEVSDVSRIPVKVEGVKFPAEIVQLLTLGSQQMADLANITIAPRGANTSAQALMEEKKTKLTGNEIIFDSTKFAKKRVGQLLIYLVQRFYTPEKIYRIVANRNSKKPLNLGGVPFSDYTEEDILHVLKTADLTKFDVAVSESMSSPTAKLTTYAILKDMQAGGVPVPFEAMIAVSDIPEAQKQIILQAIQNQQQAQAAADAEKNQTETDKTLIAHGIIPPRIKQQLQEEEQQANTTPVTEQPDLTQGETPQGVSGF